MPATTGCCHQWLNRGCTQESLQRDERHVLVPDDLLELQDLDLARGVHDARALCGGVHVLQGGGRRGFGGAATSRPTGPCHSSSPQALASDTHMVVHTHNPNGTSSRSLKLRRAGGARQHSAGRSVIDHGGVGSRAGHTAAAHAMAHSSRGPSALKNHRYCR